LLGEAFQPAIELAECGTPLTVFDHQMFGEYHARLGEEGRRILLQDGVPPATGTLVVQRELAAALRIIGQQGIDAFYAGEIAAVMSRDLERRGGLMTRRDLAEYPETVQWGDALVTTYRGLQVYAPPPPSSAIQVLETLNCIEAWSLGELSHLGAEHLTLIAEASRLARLDTDRFVGDPEFVTVPVRDLLS
jgi:gamma-glutamyltranspeptidase/glutathione hydrolase